MNNEDLEAFAEALQRVADYVDQPIPDATVYLKTNGRLRCMARLQQVGPDAVLLDISPSALRHERSRALTLLHEATHIMLPEASESETEAIAHEVLSLVEDEMLEEDVE